MKKQRFSLATQEEEIGKVIDQNLSPKNEEEGNSSYVAVSPQPNDPTSPSDAKSQHLLPSQQKGREARPMIKQMWLDPDTYNRCVEVQAERKKSRLPSSFDALAYDALVFYLNNNIPRV